MRVLESRPFSQSSEKDAFVLWLVVTLRWPLLADYLAERPSTADEILADSIPEHVLKDESRPYLARLLRNDTVKSVIGGEQIGTRLDTIAIKRLLEDHPI